MNNSHKETISIRIISCAFMVLAIAIFKTFAPSCFARQPYPLLPEGAGRLRLLLHLLYHSLCPWLQPLPYQQLGARPD